MGGGAFGRFFGIASDEEIADMVETMKKWPIRRTLADLTNEDKEAQTLAKIQWAIGMNQLQGDKSMWKDKDKDKKGPVKIFTAQCPSLHRKITKVEISVDAPWTKVFDLLMNFEEMPSWNSQVEQSATVATLPPPPDEPHKKSFIVYTRSPDNMIKIASKRDFCTCYQQEVRDTGATWIGTACETSLCPKFVKYVRGDTVIIVVNIKSTGEKSCHVTQIGAFNVKGTAIQSIVDSGVMKSFAQFGENLRKQAVL